MKWILNIAFLCCFVGSFAQVEQPVAKINKDSILIGEEVLLDLSVKTYAPSAVEFLTPGDTLGSGVEVLEKAELDTLDLGSNSFEYSQTMLITAFDTGYLPIIPIKTLINGDTLETNPLLFQVQIMDVDTTLAIKDIKEIYDEPYTIGEWFKDNWKIVSVIGIGLILFIALLVYLIRRFKNKEEEIIEEEKIPLHERILTDLKVLEDKKLWQNRRVKTYYVELTDIVRAYIEERYSVNTFEKTTDEIMATMRLVAISNLQKEKLHQLLKLSDLVKFAKEKPSGIENEASIDLARDFVLQTMLEENIENQENAG